VTEVRTEFVSLSLAEAREMIGRAVDTARQLKLPGGIAVVDGGGATVSLSRMDGAPPIANMISRAKAYVSAMSGRPSAVFEGMTKGRPDAYQALVRLYPEGTFPAAGGVPIVKQGRCVGAFATFGIGPYTEIPGVDPSLLMVNGSPAMAEDLVVCKALGIPYKAQRERPPQSADYPVESISLPLPLDEARAIANRAIAQAEQAGARIAVCIVDEYGAVIQHDRMDGAAAMMIDVSESKAITTLNFQRPSSAVGQNFAQRPERAVTMRSIVRFKIQPDGGGLLITRGDHIVGAIGVAGVAGEQCEEMAKAALG
jgi:glc operon protein GlcG